MPFYLFLKSTIKAYSNVWARIENPRHWDMEIVMGTIPWGI